MSPFPESCLQTAHALADAAAQIAQDTWFADTETRFKPDQSALTDADTQIEEHLRHMIRDNHPDHGILGEEFGGDALDRPFVWVIDPIDGTRQYAARLMNFGVLIALCHHGRPVLGLMDQPLAGARFLGVEGAGSTLNGRPVRASNRRGLSQATVAIANPASFPPEDRPAIEAIQDSARMAVFDGGCLAYGALARGQVDICLNGPDLNPHDICALVPIVQEAGGVITGWDGVALTLASEGAILAAATPELHAAAIDRLSRHDPVWVP